MSKKNYLVIVACVLLTGCAEAIMSAQDTVQSAADGVEASTERLENTVGKPLQGKSACNLSFSDKVKALPISFGSCRFQSASSANNHILSIYISFVDNANEVLTAVVKDENGNLKGSASARISGVDGDNDFYKFIFADSINITTYDKILIE
jgi:hypothetical protein